MALSKRDRVGLVLLIGLFSIFALLLFFTVDRPSGAARGIENNVLIEQRMESLRERQSF